jgi:hypothetical protein
VSLRRLADVMMGAGLALGAVAVLGYVFNVVPDLPPALLKLVIYKLVAIGALGLIAFGAILGRLHRRLADGPEQAGPSVLEALPGHRVQETIEGSRAERQPVVNPRPRE